MTAQIWLFGFSRANTYRRKTEILGVLEWNERVVRTTSADVVVKSSASPAIDYNLWIRSIEITPSPSVLLPADRIQLTYKVDVKNADPIPHNLELHAWINSESIDGFDDFGFDMGAFNSDEEKTIEFTRDHRYRHGFEYQFSLSILDMDLPPEEIFYQPLSDSVLVTKYFV
jgi:hypothetical protein